MADTHLRPPHDRFQTTCNSCGQTFDKSDDAQHDCPQLQPPDDLVDKAGRAAHGNSWQTRSPHIINQMQRSQMQRAVAAVLQALDEPTQHHDQADQP